MPLRKKPTKTTVRDLTKQRRKLRKAQVAERMKEHVGAIKKMGRKVGYKKKDARGTSKGLLEESAFQ